MLRRALLGSVAGVACAAFATPSHAQSASDVRERILALNTATFIQLGLGVGARDATFRNAQSEFAALSRMDPRWGTWNDSAELAHLLFSVANPSDQARYTLACQMVIDSWQGARNMTGSTAASMRTICASAAYLLRNPASFSGMATSRAETAVLLLCFVAVAPGNERQDWARLGLEQTRLHGLNVLRTWSRDGMTGRWAAIGTIVAGDISEGLILYDGVVQQRTGVMEDLAQGRRPPPRSIGEAIVNGLSAAVDAVTDSEVTRGMAQTMAGMPALRAEAATAAMLANRHDQAVQLFEAARIDASTSASTASALVLEASLLQNGVVLVQAATTSIGSIALVSIRRSGRVQRFHATNYAAGGLTLLEGMAGYMQGFSRRPGLLHRYDRASRSNARRVHEEMRAYVDFASETATTLAGAAILTALRGANVPAGAEVLIVLSPALAFLPIGLSRLEGGPTLMSTYKLRYATSLAGAAASATAAAQAEGRASTVALVGARARNAPPFAAFESAAVQTLFSTDARRAPATGNDPAAILASLQGANYWHIASHGVWDLRDQEDAGLLLAGRRPTTVAQVQAFRPSPPPRLVYMSACSTNMISVERDLNDFVGLNTAFLNSGAAGAIGAQWVVDDAASTLLAANFYERHRQQGQSPVVALHAAQTWLRNASAAQASDFVETLISAGRLEAATCEPILGYLADLPADAPPFQHPYYWGGFQLYGV